MTGCIGLHYGRPLLIMAFLTILYGFCGASEVVGDMGQSRKFNITGGVRQGRVLFRAVLPWAMIRVST